MARCTRWTAAVLLAASLGAAACGGDDSDDRAEPSDTTAEAEDQADEGDATKEDYAAALGEGTVGLSDEDNMCLGLAIVEAVGLERLQDAGALGELEDDPEASLDDLGITLDDGQTAALLDGLHGCGDVRGMFKQVLATGGQLQPEAASCVIDGLDDTLFDRLLVASIAGGEEALDADPELTTGLQDAVLACVDAGTGE